MTQKEAIKIFEEKKVRTVWDDEQEKWYTTLSLDSVFKVSVALYSL